MGQKNNHGTQMENTNGNLEHFWASQLEAYPKSGKKTLTLATTCLCEPGFSYLLHIKTMISYRVDPQHNMRIELSTRTPKFDAIII